MKKVNDFELSAVYGGQSPNKEPAPIGIAGGGNPDQWGAYVNVNIPVTDNVYVSPHVVVDNSGGFHNPGIQVTWFLP